ncbi:uncharacterized protein LOC105692196 [Athalia rosae]|uniref:uncharacterized protein LOC105692196 n=1 Tax=Athalia rosae TaxID=37344 RepID=UPI0020339A56|nr:uncharacterized protein LOC105692196 [Athalia rosae]
MKNISNSVFPLDEIQKSDLIEPFKLSRSVAHNPKVLRYNWQSLALAEPRENTDFKPPNGSLHRSSYKRLGPDEPKTGISETHRRLKEIDLKNDYISIFPHRSTMNMFSFNLTECVCHPIRNYYRTTSKTDYPLHFPMKPWPSSSTDKPWLLYRRTMSYTDEELSERNCIDKFYDENMRIHNEIAVMKLERYRSYDPISKEFTDPCKLAEYKFHASNYPTLLSLLLQQERVYPIYFLSLAGRK